MSKENNCPNAPQGGYGFKGIENFFKRVAYNLGNSASQTEVKIISCVPIDVTDLQQKIARLEKQLEEAKGCKSRANVEKQTVNTAICECSVKKTEVCSDTLDVCRNRNPCDVPHVYICPKKRSVASLFRRSYCPSKGKIIYPNVYPCPSQNISSPNDSLHLCQSADIPCNIKNYKPCSSRKKFFKKFKCKNKIPKTHCVYYAQAKSNPFNTINEQIDEVPKKINTMTHTYITEMINKQYRAKPLGENLSEISSFSSPICRDTPDFNRANIYESDLCSCCHQGFHNIDKYISKNRNPTLLRSNRLITQEEYYDSTLYDVIPVKEKPVKTKKALNIPNKKAFQSCVNINTFANVPTYAVSKHLYKTLPHGTEPTTLRKNRRGHVHQIKKITKNSNKFSTINWATKLQESKSCYVDIEHSQNNPGTYSKKPMQLLLKNEAEDLTTVVNNKVCHAGISVKNLNTNSKTENTIDQIKNILQSVLQEVKVTAISRGSTCQAVNNDTAVQKGNNNRSGNPAHGNMINHIQSNNTEKVQGNVAGNLQSNVPNDVFGQIVGNQQSYMTSSFSDGIPKNMQVPAHMQGSRLLNSFTYSPYNTNPCMVSSSNQSNNNSYCYSQHPFRYISNYPILVHSPHGYTCAFCYRHNSYLKPNCNKQATTIGTNTENVNDEPTKESNKLIKEIYKSMPLNMGIDIKDNSQSEDDNAQVNLDNFQIDRESMKKGEIIPESLKEKKKEEEQPQLLKENNKIINDVQDVSELFRKKYIQFSSDSRNMTTDSRQESIDVSIRSHIVSETDIKNNHRKVILNDILNLAKQSTTEESRQEEIKNTSTTTQDTVSNTISQTETVTKESEDVRFGSRQFKNIQFQRSRQDKNKKQGLFSKIYKFLFTPRGKKAGDKNGNLAEAIKNDELSSDSDDYQTVYNPKVERRGRPIARLHYLPRRRTHSKIAYNKHVCQKDF